MLSKTAPLFISDCHPSAPLGALPKALLCVWCTACGSLLWDPGLYIGPLGAQCAQSFHSTSERFPQYKTLLFSSSPVTAKTTVWFLDGTEYAGGWLTLSKRLGERSCKPGLGTLHVKSCDAEKCLYGWSCVLWKNCPAVGKDIWKMVQKQMEKLAYQLPADGGSLLRIDLGRFSASVTQTANNQSEMLF